MLDRYRHVERELSNAMAEKAEAEAAAKKAEERILMLRPWLEELKAGICPTCDGHGYIQRWYAQDDVVAEKCKACAGAGVRPNYK